MSFSLANFSYDDLQSVIRQSIFSILSLKTLITCSEVIGPVPTISRKQLSYSSIAEAIHT